MRVGLDLLYLTPGETGGRESYARELVPAMLARSAELELVAFVNRDAGARLAAELGEGVHAVVLPISARKRWQWALGELALMSVAAARAQVQLLHSMANFAPVWGPFHRVLTLHDMQYKLHPELLSWPMRTGTAAMIALAARRIDRIIAVSHAGRDEIIAGLSVDPRKIDVVPNGVRPAPGAPPTGELPTGELRAKLRLDDRPVVLCVASDLPHKNLAVLLDALAAIDAAVRPVLLFAGYATDTGALTSRAGAAGVAADIRALGHCSSEQLERLYALADCLALPTLHEGFGLPVLEAMARSLPVVCSDIPALREVAGEAAVYVDPRDPRQIAGRIGEVIADRGLAARLRACGRAQAARFSWSSAAALTLASYERALEAG